MINTDNKTKNPPLVIDLPNEVVLVEIPARRITTKKIEIDSITDSAVDKCVTATLKNRSKVILWQGADYDAIGQWTDQDVADKIKTIFK